MMLVSQHSEDKSLTLGFIGRHRREAPLTLFTPKCKRSGAVSDSAALWRDCWRRTLATWREWATDTEECFDFTARFVAHYEDLLRRTATSIHSFVTWISKKVLVFVLWLLGGCARLKTCSSLDFTWWLDKCFVCRAVCFPTSDMSIWVTVTFCSQMNSRFH